jgi:hypothetical protein
MITDKKKIIIACLLLLSTVLISLPTLNNGSFGDEFDTLAAAKLMTKGNILYRDIFSHHFPFSYYWTTLMFEMFGVSVTVARLSLVLLQLIVFFSLILLTKLWIELGVVSLIWGVLRVFYFGNMVIYPSFSAFFILAFCVLGLHALSLEKDPPWYYWLVMSFFAVLAFINDPLSVHPAVIIGIFLLIKNYRYGLRFGLYFGGFLSLFLLTFLMAGVFPDFLEGAFRFNSEYYGKYAWTDPIRVKELVRQIGTLLDLFQKKWFTFDPMRPFPADVTAVDQWFFTGFFYRLSIYLCVAVLACKKKWLSGVAVYVLAASIHVMKTKGFYAQPFNLYALFCFVFLISTLIQDRKDKEAYRKPIAIGGIALVIIFSWLSLRAIWTNYIKPENDYENSWAIYTPNVDLFNTLSCGLEDVKLAAYPGETVYYWFTDLEPVDGYLFMWPWVADYALDDVIETLSDPEIKAIVLSPNEGQIWGYEVKDFLSPLHEFVTQNYVSYNGVVFLSPALKEVCPIK